MSRLVLPLHEVPACITDSVRSCLKAHGLSLTDEILVELGRNAAQALYSIDESDPPEAEVLPPPRELLRPCIWCGYTHRFTGDADDCSKCPKCGREMSPVATRVFL